MFSCPGAIIENTDDLQQQRRSMVIQWAGNNQEQSLDILDPLYETLQYPLLFPLGHRGWGKDIRFPEVQLYSTKRHPLSQIQYYCQLYYRDFAWNHHSHKIEPVRFGRFGDLYNEYLCDMFSRVSSMNALHRLCHLIATNLMW